MATYVFTCPHGQSHRILPTSEGPGEAPHCPVCAGPMRRNYRLESVGISVARLKREREHGNDRELRDLFLETAEEAATPDDPDGSKYIREWNETHEPKETSEGKALRPEMPLHSKKVL